MFYATIQSNSATALDTTGMMEVTGITADIAIPKGIAMKAYLIKQDGTAMSYSTLTSQWTSQADMTPQGILNNGNTMLELTSIPAKDLQWLKGQHINFIIAFSTADRNIIPTFNSFEIKGTKSNSTLKITKYSNILQLSNDDNAVQITDIRPSIDTTAHATVDISVCIQDTNKAWGKWTALSDLMKQGTKIKCLAVKFKADLAAQNKSEVAKLISIDVFYDTNAITTFLEGTCDCISKTVDMHFPVSEAHLMLRHGDIPDTQILAYIALHNAKKINKELIGVGSGVKKAYKLSQANISNFGFTLYYNDQPQFYTTYSLDLAKGEVSCTAPEGASIYADYYCDWGEEQWLPMTVDTAYMENGIVNQQYDYFAGEKGVKGRVATLKIAIVQNKGTVTQEVLGTGTGEEQGFHLSHSAKEKTVKVLPDTAIWYYKGDTDYIFVTAPKGQEISVSYDWVGKTNYLKTLACIFNQD